MKDKSSTLNNTMKYGLTFATIKIKMSGRPYEDDFLQLFDNLRNAKRLLAVHCGQKMICDQQHMPTELWVKAANVPTTNCSLKAFKMIILETAGVFTKGTNMKFLKTASDTDEYTCLH